VGGRGGGGAARAGWLPGPWTQDEKPGPLAAYRAFQNPPREISLPVEPGGWRGSAPTEQTDGPGAVADQSHFQAQAMPLPLAGGAAPRTVGREGLEYLGQVLNTYLVLRQGGAGGNLLLVDQHAAHERVILAAMRRARTGGDSQPLAAPLPLSLHPAEILRLAELEGGLREVGYVLEQTANTLLVRGVPPSLPTGRAVQFLREMLDEQSDGLDSLWAMLSCKSAIKAGQPLAQDEALALLEAWLDAPEREHCPHGRPVVLSFGEGELERMFKRK